MTTEEYLDSQIQALRQQIKAVGEVSLHMAESQQKTQMETYESLYGMIKAIQEDQFRNMVSVGLLVVLLFVNILVLWLVK